MKQLFLTGLASVALLTSCSTVNNAKQAQTNRAEFMKLKGTWELTSVDYAKGYRVKPFDEGADAQCFVGSQWKLIPNNYSGTYILNGGGDCPSVTQPIKFEVVNGTEFKFKKIAEGTKAKQNLAGYSLNLASQTDSSFSLEQNVNGVRIVYNFQKVN